MGGVAVGQGPSSLAPPSLGFVNASGQLSATALANAPLSSVLEAFGFGPGGLGGLLPHTPSSAQGGIFAFPPLSSAIASTGPRLFGLSVDSVHDFVGKAATLLDEALDAPLSSRPLSHSSSRKSPRQFA